MQALRESRRIQRRYWTVVRATTGLTNGAGSPKGLVTSGAGSQNGCVTSGAGSQNGHVTGGARSEKGHITCGARSENGCVTSRAGSPKGRRLTTILVSIVVVFLLLVTPSELLNLCYYVVRHDNAASFELALVVANVLQTANFALNFLLYCACNSQFRDTWKHLFCPRSTQMTSSSPGIELGGVEGSGRPRLLCRQPLAPEPLCDDRSGSVKAGAAPSQREPLWRDHSDNRQRETVVDRSGVIALSTCRVDVHI